MKIKALFSIYIYKYLPVKKKSYILYSQCLVFIYFLSFFLTLFETINVLFVNFNNEQYRSLAFSPRLYTNSSTWIVFSALQRMKNANNVPPKFSIQNMYFKMNPNQRNFSNLVLHTYRRAKKGKILFFTNF